MIERLIILFSCLAIITAAEARMYQWQDPESGITHLSGNPPAWYRTGHGPRVIVFEKGEVIDDTQIELSADAREDLRLQAIARAEEDREIARQKAMAAEEMKARLDAGEQSGTEDAEVAPLPQPREEKTAAAEGAPDQPGELSAEGLTEDEMRALIQGWEKQRTERAMQAIQGNGN